MTVSRLFKKRSVFLTFLYSYLLMLIIPLVITCVTYSKARSLVEGEINRANEILLNQIRNTIDGKILEAQNIAIQIAINPLVVSSATDDDNGIEPDKFNDYKIVEQLKVMKTPYDVISDIYIYYTRSGMVTSVNSRLTSMEFYDSYYANNKLHYNEWTNILRNKYHSISSLLYTNEGEKTISIIQSIPIQNRNKPLANAVIVFDYLKLQGYINNAEYLNGSGIIILAKDNNLLISSDSKYNSIDISKYDAKDKKGFIYDTVNGEKSVIKIFESKETGCKYVSVIPYKVFWEKVDYFRNINVFGILLFIVVGGAASYFLTQKSYNPVKAAINKISENSQIKYNKGENNEFEFIDKVFNFSIEEREDLKDKIKAGQDILRESFLSKVLQGKFLSGIPTYEAFEQYDIKLFTNNFAVILLNIENNNNNLSRWSQSKDSELVSFVIRNVIEELASKEHKGFVIELDRKTFACIFNVNSEENSKDIINTKILSICEEAKTFLEKRCKIFCSIAVSDIHSHIQGINEAYEEALDALEYRIVIGKNSIITYDSIKNRISDYNYNTKTEYKLINFLKNNEEPEKVLDMVEQIFQESGLDNNSSIQMTKCFMYDVTTTLAKIINEICEPSFIKDSKSINRLMTTETLSDLRLEVISILYEVCSYLKEKKGGNSISNEVKLFIDENYFDANINVNMLGEKYDITASYLSKLFKDQVGIGILDYLCKVRIGRAKELLRDTEISIGDIAGDVGFLSSSVFIRTFKKYEGITPGAYRDL